MIKAEGIRSDYQKIVDGEGSDVSKIVKIMRLVIELLLNIRTNQTPEGREKAQRPSKPEATK